MKKIFFFDVDGTLLPHGTNEKVSQKSLYAISELKRSGHEVVIATGKSTQMIKDILDELEMKTYIACNGAIIYMNGKVIYSNPISKDELTRMIKYCQMNGLMFGVQHDDEYYMLDININYEQYSSAFGSLNLQTPKVLNIKDKEIYQAWILGNDIDCIIDENVVDGFKQLKWHNHAADILSKSVSKRNAIKQYLNIKYDEDVEIYAFGDGNNDVEMIEYADYGIVMGNATEKLKSVSNIITDTCKDDGVYNYLVKNNIIEKMER